MLEWLLPKRQEITSIDKNMAKRKSLCSVGGNVSCCSYYGKQYESVRCSVVSDFVTTRTAVHQAPLFMEFFRQEYWSGQPLSSPGDLPDSGIELGSPALWADSLPSEPPRKNDPLGFHSWVLQITGQKIVYFEICCCNGKF